QAVDFFARSLRTANRIDGGHEQPIAARILVRGVQRLQQRKRILAASDAQVCLRQIELQTRVGGICAHTPRERLDSGTSVPQTDLGGLQQRVELRVGWVRVDCRRENMQRRVRLIELQLHASQELARLDVVGRLLDGL